MICKMLDTLESVILHNSDTLSKEDLEEYVTMAIYAHKHYGRKSTIVSCTIDMIDGVTIWSLKDAGLTHDDYMSAYQNK